MLRLARQEAPNRLQRSVTDSVPAPVGGWNDRDPVAAMPPSDAVTLENWIVRSQAVQTRLGSLSWVTGLPNSAVETLMAYNSGTPRLFAAVGTEFYDVTTSGPAGSPVQTGLSNARWQYVNFSNSAGAFLIAVNGADGMRRWNGSSWVTETTLGALSTSTVNNIAVYQQRLFLLQNDSLSFWYLAAGAISGSATEFRVGQVARKGGKLIGIDTWTLDAGEGLDDHLVLATSEGEVIVYKGTDPGSATDWALVGVYNIGRPLGRRCFLKFGGDLLLLADRGLYPLSKALQSSSINRSIALSDKISQTFNTKGASLFSQFGWQVELHTRESFIIVSVPDSPRQQFVMDLITGGWSQFTGWDVRSMCYFQGDLYYGGIGEVVKAYTGTADKGSAIQAKLLTGYNYFQTRGRTKQISLLRPIFASTGGFSFTLALLGDFERQIPPASLFALPSTVAVWDASLWDSAVWSSDYSLSREWRTVWNDPSHNFGLAVQIASASVTVQLLAIDYIYKIGWAK